MKDYYSVSLLLDDIDNGNVFITVDLYNFLAFENYKNYLEGIGVLIQEVRPIKYEELIDLGCSGDSCLMAPSWVYSSTYWAGTANSSNNVFAVLSTGILQGGTSYSNVDRGVRVVVKMSLIYF